jgi:hypothetical protein
MVGSDPTLNNSSRYQSSGMGRSVRVSTTDGISATESYDTFGVFRPDLISSDGRRATVERSTYPQSPQWGV